MSFFFSCIAMLASLAQEFVTADKLKFLEWFRASVYWGLGIRLNSLLLFETHVNILHQLNPGKYFSFETFFSLLSIFWLVIAVFDFGDAIYRSASKSRLDKLDPFLTTKPFNLSPELPSTHH